MKIKSILLAFTVVFMQISCERELSYSLTSDVETVVFDASGNGPSRITIENENVNWTASLDQQADWISIESDETGISVVVEENLSRRQRSCNIIVSPSDDVAVESLSVAVTQSGADGPEITQMSIGTVWYYAQDFLFDTNGTDEWRIDLYSQDTNVEFEWVDLGEDGYWIETVTEGSRIALYLYCEPTEDFYNPKISCGIYSPHNDIYSLYPMSFATSQHVLGTPWPQGSFMMEYDGTFLPEYIDVVDGKVEVDFDGSEYYIYAELELTDGKRVAYEYTGDLTLSILGNPPYYSGLTEDLYVETEDIADAAIVYGKQDNYFKDIAIWNIKFLGKGIVVGADGGMSGNGCFGNVELSSPFELGTEFLPEGEYVIDSDYDKPFTFECGKYDRVLGYSGTYFYVYNEEDSQYAPLAEGTLTVKHNGGDDYLFEIDGMDDNGHKIVVSYEGKIKRVG